MGYAVRADGQGWRAVNSNTDLEAGEIYSEVEPSVVIDSIPKVVTKLQIMEAMMETGVTANSNMWVSFKTLRASNDLLNDYWLSALDVNRNHPMTLGMKALMNKTDADIDDLFVLASTK